MSSTISQQRSDHNLQKRSLAELDDVIDEIIARNPEFMQKLEKIIAESLEQQGSK